VLAMGQLPCACLHSPAANEPTPVAAMLESKPFRDPPDTTPSDTHTREALPIPGHGSAVISIPTDRGRRVPLLVVLHGAGDRPEWQCEWWDGAMGGRALIACLRGKAAYPRHPDTGYYFPDHYYLDRLVVAATRAIRNEYGSRVDERAVLIGFSQGANMGALVASRRPELFTRLLLIEGGYEQWNVAAAQRLGSQNPAARVVFACGQSYCANHARESQRWLTRGGVESRTLYAPGVGHTYAGQVGEQAVSSLRWLLE
jgi:pimeloyl-ACP methyl ester carboxylesterase